MYQVGRPGRRRLGPPRGARRRRATPCSSATTGAPRRATGPASLQPGPVAAGGHHGGAHPWPPSAAAFFTYAQLKRSFYVFLFQTPLAEMAVGADDHRVHRRPVGGLVAGLRRRLGRGPGQGVHRRPGRLCGRHRLLPGHVRPDPPQPRLRRGPGGVDGRLPPTHPVPPRRRRRLHGRRRHRRRARRCCQQGSEHVVVEDAGHFLHLEQPEVVQRPRPATFLDA